MAVLAVDTAFRSGGAALVKEGRVLGEVILSSESTHTTRLAASLDFLLEQTGLGKKDLTGLAVTLGPGQFTGLRIGLAAVQGLALGLSLPVAGLSTLRLLAASVPAWRGAVWALADARRGLLYAAPFHNGPDGLIRRGEDMAITPARLAPLLEPPALVVGRGTAPVWDLLSRPGLTRAPDWCGDPRPGLLGLLGEARISAGEGLDPGDLRARYCRPSDAEVRFGLPLDDYRLVE